MYLDTKTQILESYSRYYSGAFVTRDTTQPWLKGDRAAIRFSIASTFPVKLISANLITRQQIVELSSTCFSERSFDRCPVTLGIFLVRFLSGCAVFYDFFYG